MSGSGQKRVLLSSVCKPFGERYGDGFGVSYEGSHQIMWANGLFRPRATTTQWGIDFIAANLQTPTTTLHYPTMKQFIKEIKKGYDYVGIAFVSSTYHKMIPMLRAIREHAPGTKIILGGYGTALGEEIEGLADYVCQGEGVAFMRELLGEPLETPLEQPQIVQRGTLFSLPILGPTGYVFAGLGCPNGCDFCATSHYYKRKHIRILPTGGAILEAIQRLRQTNPAMTSFWINDEDFLLNEERGRQFLDAIRRSDLPPLSLSIFSSVKALSQFQASELVEMGIDWVWVGFEGKRAGYTKMEGRDYGDLFTDLHRHGISVLASMILGFDYQTEDIIRAEYEELLSLRPSMTQFLIYGPTHGTPAHARMVAEGRLVEEVMKSRHLHDGFTLGFRHPHMGPEEMSSLQRHLFQEEFRRMGPAIFRIIDDWMEGYETLRDHPAERVRAKALRYAKDCHMAMMLIPASKGYVDEGVRAWLDRLERRIVRETGPLSRAERLAARLIPAMLRYTDFKLRHDLWQQPPFTRRAFRPRGLLASFPLAGPLIQRLLPKAVPNYRQLSPH